LGFLSREFVKVAETKDGTTLCLNHCARNVAEHIVLHAAQAEIHHDANQSFLGWPILNGIREKNVGGTT